MADIKLILGADVPVSLEQLKQDINDIQNQLGDKRLRIRFEVNQDEIKKAAGEIKQAFGLIDSVQKSQTSAFNEAKRAVNAYFHAHYYPR